MKKKIPKRDLFKYILISALFFALVWVIFFFGTKNADAKEGEDILGLLQLSLLHLAIWLFGHAVLMQNPIRLLHFIGLEVLFSIFIVVLFFVGRLSILLIPVLSFSLLAATLFNPFIATFMSMALVLYTMVLFSPNAHVVIAYLVSSTFATLTVEHLKQRMHLIISGVISGVIMYLIIISEDFTNMRLEQAYALLNGVISPVLAIGIMPIMESVFSMVTPMRLMELSNTTKPLIKKLMMEAPGTYHHSLYTGHLAEAAAADIGADTFLARTGAYYHDVGKLYKPDYFYENQAGAENPHDSLSPEESAEILSRHVTEGVAILKKNRLPKPVIDIARSHHGDSIMQYFYDKALKSDPNVDVQKFSYKGIKPRTKEETIVMLADCVEAACRANQEVDPEITIGKVIDQKVKEGQLSDSELSFAEIAIIKKSFRNAMNASGHDRLKYPKDINPASNPNDMGGSEPVDTESTNVDLQE